MGIEGRWYVSGAFYMHRYVQRKHAAKVVCEPHSRQGDDQPLPNKINLKEGGGVLAREKISDSLLDGSRTESY